MENRRRKKTTRGKENDAFVKTLCNQYEIMKLKLEKQKEEARESMNQAFRSLVFQFPPDLLKTKVKDLPLVETFGSIRSQNKEGTGVTEGSHGRIIESGSLHRTGVSHKRSLLQVATESNMSKAAGSNSLSKYIGTPSASSVSSAGILRIPEPGEYAVSATGSPLLVSSSATDTVNVNIPLKNGKKIAILPNADVIPDAICNHLDPEVKSQLKQLTNTLTMILRDA